MIYKGTNPEEAAESQKLSILKQVLLRSVSMRLVASFFTLIKYLPVPQNNELGISPLSSSNCVNYS